MMLTCHAPCSHYVHCHGHKETGVADDCGSIDLDVCVPGVCHVACASPCGHACGQFGGDLLWNGERVLFEMWFNMHWLAAGREGPSSTPGRHGGLDHRGRDSGEPER